MRARLEFRLLFFILRKSQNALSIEEQLASLKRRKFQDSEMYLFAKIFDVLLFFKKFLEYSIHSSFLEQGAS